MAAPALSKGGKEASNLQIIIGVGLALAFLLILGNTSFEGLEPKGSQFLGLLGFVICLWVFDVFPAGFSGMLFMVLAVLMGLAGSRVVFSGFTSSTTWLIFASLVIGAAADACGLAKRIAYFVIFKLKVDSPNKLLLAFILCGCVLTFFLPSVFGRIAVLMPLALGLIAAMKADKDSKLARFIIMSMYVGALGWKLAIMTGMEPILIPVNALREVGINIYYGSYFGMWALPAILLNPVLYFFTVWFIFRLKPEDFSKESIKVITDEYQAMPPISSKEKWCALWLCLAVVLWFTDFIHHVDAAWVGVLAVCAMFAPKIRVMTVKQMQEKVNFLNLLFFASTLAIPALYNAVGVGDWLGGLMATHLQLEGQTFGTAFLVSLIVHALHLVLSTIASSMSTMTPLLLTLATQTGIDPVWLIFLMISGVSVFLFPYQAGPLVMTYSLGYLRMSDVLKIGGVLTIATLIITPILASTWFNWVIPIFVER